MECKKFCALLIVVLSVLSVSAKADNLDQLKGSAEVKAAEAEKALAATQELYEKLEAAKGVAVEAKGACVRALGASVSTEAAIARAVNDETTAQAAAVAADADLQAREAEVLRLANIAANTKAQADLDAMKAAVTEVGKASAGKNHADASLTAAKQYVTDTTAASETAQTKSQIAQKHEKDANEVVEQLTVEATNAERRSSRASRHAAIAMSSYKNALQDDQIGQQSTTIAAQKTEIDQLRSDLTSLKQDHDNLVKTVANKSDRTELDTLLKNLETAIGLKADKTSVDAVNGRVGNLETELKNLRTEVESLKGEVSKKTFSDADAARKAAEALNNAEKLAKDAKATYEAVLAARKQLYNVITVRRTVYVEDCPWELAHHSNGFWYHRYN